MNLYINMNYKIDFNKNSKDSLIKRFTILDLKSFSNEKHLFLGLSSVWHALN